MKTRGRTWVAGTPRLRPTPVANKHCPGCGHPLVERMVAEVIEELDIAGKVVTVTGAGCSSSFCARVAATDGLLGPHGRATDIATAIKRVHPDAVVYTVQGDGDCLAIGAEGLVNAAGRAEPITVIMINNVGYGTTGGQAAPTTLMGQVTVTTPRGRDPSSGYPVHAVEMLATFRGVAYAARGAVDSPAHYQRCKRHIKTAFEKQLARLGFTFVEILSMCPPDWHLTPLESLDFIAEKMIPEFPLGVFKEIKAADG